MRCVALIVDCQTLNDFIEIFKLTCVVALQSYEDALIQSTCADSAKDARKKLESYIAIRPINIDNYLQITDLDDTNIHINNEDLNDTNSPIEKFIKDIIEEARETKSIGVNLNAFYLPNFVDQLQRIGKGFPLWSAIGTPYFSDHSTSSSCETNFEDIKERVLSKYHKNLRVDKFVKIHLLDLIGGTRIFSSKLLNFKMKICSDCESDLINKHPLQSTKKSYEYNYTSNNFYNISPVKKIGVER